MKLLTGQTEICYRNNFRYFNNINFHVEMLLLCKRGIKISPKFSQLYHSFMENLLYPVGLVFAQNVEYFKNPYAS